MFLRHHLDDFTRSRITEKVEEERPITDVAFGLNFPHSIVFLLWRTFHIIGMCSNVSTTGCFRSPTAAENWQFALSAKGDRYTTVSQMANHFHTATNKRISQKTIVMHLHQEDLYARRFVVTCVWVILESSP